MDSNNQLISKLREIVNGLVPSANTIAALAREAANTISDQQDYIDNLERGLSTYRSEIYKINESLSSLREDYNATRKLLAELTASQKINQQSLCPK